MPDFYEEIVKIVSEGKSAAVATIIGTKGSTPREAGAKMLIREDGKIWGSVGGGCLEAEVWQEAMKVIQEEKPRTIHFDLTGKKAEESGMICGGIMDLYIEPVVPAPRVFIFGGGHVSQYLARMSTLVGFQITVVDDRPQFANPERFPEAQEVIAEEFPMALPKLKVNKSSYLVIVTRGHAYDQEVLEWAVGTDARYIGMIGSKKKIQTVYGNLEAKGIPPGKMKRVHAPIGLSIGAVTPEEIAVAIVAEMIQERRRVKGEKVGLRARRRVLGAQSVIGRFQERPEDILSVERDPDSILQDMGTLDDYHTRRPKNLRIFATASYGLSFQT